MKVPLYVIGHLLCWQSLMIDTKCRDRTTNLAYLPSVVEDNTVGTNVSDEYHIGVQLGEGNDVSRHVDNVGRPEFFYSCGAGTWTLEYCNTVYSTWIHILNKQLYSTQSYFEGGGGFRLNNRANITLTIQEIRDLTENIMRGEHNGSEAPLRGRMARMSSKIVNTPAGNNFAVSSVEKAEKAILIFVSSAPYR